MICEPSLVAQGDGRGVGQGVGWGFLRARGAWPQRTVHLMSIHQLDQAVFRPALPEDIGWEPFPSFPPPARLAVVVGTPSEPAPYVVRDRHRTGYGTAAARPSSRENTRPHTARIP